MPCTATPVTRPPGARVPLYSRLRQALRDRVTSGEWQPGDRIPTIRELCEVYGVSRITVVQALDTLAHEGFLQRWQGKGVFININQLSPEAPRLPLMSFSEETARRGQVPTSRTLRLCRQQSTPHLMMTGLKLRPDEAVVILERLRLVDGTPYAVQQAYLPEHLVPGLLDRREPIDSLYRVLTETYGILPTNATESYVPIRLAPDHAQLLETEPGSAAFQVERITSDQHGRPIEFASSVLRGDRFEVRLRLSRSSSPLASGLGSKG
jgi:GntR family transcriptional regulator